MISCAKPINGRPSTVKYVWYARLKTKESGMLAPPLWLPTKSTGSSGTFSKPSTSARW